MRELALHVLDILQNAVEAGAHRVVLTIGEDLPEDRLEITVADDGQGMDARSAAQALDPFYTSRNTRHVGLGLPLYAEAARRAGGALHVRSAPNAGTEVSATFRHSHPDRQPLGDMTGTLLAFLVAEGCPELVYSHRVALPSAPSGDRASGDARTFRFDTVEARVQLGDLPFSHPAVLAWLSEFLNEGESSLWERQHAEA